VDIHGLASTPAHVFGCSEAPYKSASAVFLWSTLPIPIDGHKPVQSAELAYIKPREKERLEWGVWIGRRRRRVGVFEGGAGEGSNGGMICVREGQRDKDSDSSLDFRISSP